MTHEDTRPPLSPTQAGRRLGLTDESVRTMIHDGKLAAFMINGRFKIPAAEVDRLMAPYRAASASA